MKKLLLLLLTVMMGISSLTLSAQNTLTVANGTTTNSNVPIYGLWADAYLRCQTIYTADALEAAADVYGMNGGTITSLTYYLSSPAAAAWTGTWEIKLMEVTASTLSAFVDMTDATLVFTGTLDATSSPLIITLDAPYTYQGGNLLIEVSQTTPGVYKSASFYGVSSNGASWQGYNSSAWSSITGSAQNFIPKTTFTFTGGAEITCRPVQNLTVNEAQTTSSSMTLNWVDTLNSGATYSVYNMADNTLVQDGISETTFTVTGLDANTEYLFGVEANCSPTDASAKMTAGGHTSCGAISVLPYTDGFENVPSGSYQMPYCWDRYASAYTSSATYPYSYNGNANTGSRSLYFFGTTGSSYSDTMIAVMPQLDVTTYPMSSTRVTFWAKVTSSPNTKYVYVGTMANPADPTTFFLVDSVLVSGSTYTMYSVPMTNATDSYVAFVVYKGNGTVYVDDVTLEELPSCFEVTNLSVSGVTSNSVTLQWSDAMNTDATYSIYVANDLVGSATDTTYTVTGLEPNTTYTFGVEANCSNGDGSVMTISATTSCAAEELPFNEDFSVTLSGDACWRGASNITADSALNGGALTLAANTQWTYCSSESNGLPAGHYRVNIYGTSCKKWMITPELDMSNVTSPLLTFDAAFTAYTSTSSAPASGFEDNASQKFMVLVTTNNCQSWTLVNDISLAALASSSYLTQYIDLSEFAGETVRIAFYAQSLVSGGDNNLHIDNILVEESTGALCLPVSMLAANNVTATEATLSWNGSADSYNIYLIADGDTTFVQNVTEESFDITGLTAMTSYTYGVCAVCNGDESPIVTVTFGTACTALTLPYTETFETTSGTLSCWSVEGDGNWTFATGDYSTATGAFQGSQNAKITHSVTGNVTKLISPVLDDVQSGLVLDFAYVLRSWSGDIDELRVYARTDADSAWQMYGEFTDATAVWVTQTVIIPGTVYQVAFEYTDNYGYGLGLDSVVFTAMVGDYCYAVTDLTVDNVTSTSLSLSWSDDNNSGITYTIYDMADNSVVATGVTTTSYDVTGLTSSTSYTFGVEANCSATSASSIVTVSAVTYCAAGGCLITIEGADSYGDGWNGNAINVIQDDVTIGTFTLLNGYSATESYSVCSSSPVTFSWVAGSYSNETSFQILDGGGAVVYTVTDGSSLTDGTVFFTLNDACPSCAPATDLTVDNTSGNSITISWTGSAPSYDVYNGNTFVANVTTNTYTFTGLAPSTNYTFGVQAICSATDSAAMVTIAASTECGVISTYPYVQDFATAPACWMILDADGDGQNWILYQGTIQSASYNSGVLTPDNWLISPQFAIPATGNYEVTWTATAQDQSWPAEHYGVFVSTTGYSDTANFTMLQEWTLGPGIFNPVIDLSGYAGQNIYIALRHFNCTDQFRLSIDDFIVREQAGANQVTINAGPNNPAYGTVAGAGIYNIGDNVTLTATPSSEYTFSKWVDENNTLLSNDNPYTFVAATDLTLTAIFLNAAGTTYTITVDVNDSTMGTATGGGTYTAGDQITLTATPFTGYNFVNWTQVSSFGTNVVGTDPDLIITVTSDKTFVANFELGSGPVITDPTVATVAASAVEQTTATLNATITNPDNVTITAKGFEWKATAGGTYTQIAGTGTGNTFTANLTGLTANTGYTYKAFITFNGTTVYGSEMTFTTLPEDTPEPCETPTNLDQVIELKAEGSIILTWTDNAGVSEWNLQYRPLNGEWITVVVTGSPNYTITGLESGDVYEIHVQAVCGNGVVSEWSSILTATATNSGIEDHLSSRISLYPNPANDVVNVQCTMYNVQSVEVIDVYGKVIKTMNVTENPTRINVSGLANGMYFVRVTTEEGTVTKSFVKK